MNREQIEAFLPYSKKLDLLYVQEDPFTEKSLDQIFKELFSSVYLAKDIKEGLAFFSDHDIDIVIVDIDISTLRGLEMARTMKSQKHDIPIIVLSAHLDDFLAESIEIGIDAYLLKPIEEKILLKTIDRIVNNIRAIKSMHEDSRYFRVLTEASIVSKSNIDGIITYVNDNLCDISGYTPQELIGRSHRIFRHPNSSNAMFKEMWDTILRGQAWRGRMQNLTKSGNTFLADSIIIPLKDSKGAIVEFIAIRQDITEIVNLKREIHSELLEKEEQQRLDEAKKKFLVLFTHELKTPLNAIINFSKYIHSKLIDSQYLEPVKTARLLRSITSNANEMLQNVDNILDLAKLRAQRLHYNIERFNINTLIPSLLEQYSLLIESKNIEVESLFDEACEIVSDKYRVRQVISNILSNAIKYGDNRISIEIKRSKSTVELYIDDNGKGIEDKESVFDLYEQGDRSLMKRATQGTGVGLYFVRLACDGLDIDHVLEDSKRLGGTRFGLIFKIDNDNERLDR